MLFVSIIGMGPEPAGKPYCPVEYRGGGGGRTLVGVLSQPLLVAMAKASPKLLLPFSTPFFVFKFLQHGGSWMVASGTAWPAGVRWTRCALELVDRVPQGATGCQDR